jgi:hypothetical protein
LRIA